MIPHSLRLRLVAGGVIAILVALLIAGIGLSYLFERHVMRSMADTLEVELRQVLASVELDVSGKPHLIREPTDPRFSEPLSGYYWQVTAAPNGLARSRSLWDSTLPLPADELSPGDVHQHRIVGPGGSDLLAIERTVLLKSAAVPTQVRVVVASDVAKLAEARRSFVADLIPSLALLGGILAAAMWIQIGLGLRPLARVREGIAAIRAGVTDEIEAAVPSEVAPLVDEINGLVMAQERDLERARGRAADLAHGLKTPLAALSADIRALRERGDVFIADRIEEVSEAMRRHVERELARSRIRGKRGFTAMSSTPLKPLIETLVSIQRRTAQGQRLDFEIALTDAAGIAMDKADLAEVLGNLLENASRHAHMRVRIGLAPDGRVAIEDDGPGVPENLRDWVLKRGRRLDERPDSAGLGLAIVQDVLAAYDRRLMLETSELGGLKVLF